MSKLQLSSLGLGTTAKPKPRWYQFSLKTLLVAMTLFCLGPGGYVAHEQRKARAQKAMVMLIEKLGGSVNYDIELPVRSPMMGQILGDDTYGNLDSISFVNAVKNDNKLRPIAFFDADLVPIAGLKGLTHLDLDDTQVTDSGFVYLARLKKLEVLSLTNSRVGDAGLMHLSGLKQVKDLWLDGTLVTDEGMMHLSGLTELNFLNLDGMEISGAGLVHLSGLTKLETLSLTNTRVGDTSLQHLSALKQIEVLWLDGTRVTDAGLVHLAGLTRLRLIHLGNTQVTDAGVVKLQKALPNCVIDGYPIPAR